MERLGVLSAQIEHGLPRLDRALRLAQLVGRDVGDLGADLRLGGVARGVLELALIDGVELLPCSLELVDARERGNDLERSLRMDHPDAALAQQARP